MLVTDIDGMNVIPAKPAIEVEIVARGKNREEAEMLSDQIYL